MKQEITLAKNAINSGMDKVIIPNFFEGIKGGRTLDVSCLAEGVDVINAGCPVVTDGNGNYAPCTVSEGAYAIPSDKTIVGVVVATTLKSKPAVSIMTRGSINSVAAPYYNATVIAAVKAACPLISFTKDEEA